VRLQIENKELKRQQLQGAERLLRLDQLEQENRHLRALLEARERQPVKSVVAEIMHRQGSVLAQGDPRQGRPGRHRGRQAVVDDPA
jgi:cell shape-determining protein MreC